MSRYSLRLLPSATLAGTALLAVGWAVRSGLDAALDRSVLAVLTTAGLALVLDDRAASLTAAAPVGLRRRRRWPVALGSAASVAGWSMAWLAAWIAPSRWDLIEWLVVAAGQLAVGAVVTRRRPASTPIGPALTAAGFWLLVTNLHDVAPRLYPLADHRLTWLAILAAFVGVGVGVSTDPGARRRRRGLAPLVALAALAVPACVPPSSPAPTTTSTTTTTTSTTTTTTLAPLVAITASDPASPSLSFAPRLVGFAPGATTTVRLFDSIDCTGALAGAGDLAEFHGAGIAVFVAAGTTTSFTALASGPGVAACSAPFEFVNTAVAPTAFEHEPNDTVDDAVDVDLGSDGRADIAGRLDGVDGGAADLFDFAVPPGASIRIETFDRTGVTCDLTDTRIVLTAPAGSAGAIDEDDGVGGCSRIDPLADPAAASEVAGGNYRVLVQGQPIGGDYQLRVEALP